MRMLNAFLSWFRQRTIENTDLSGWATLYLPRGVATETARMVTSFGTPDDPHEGIAYWAGVVSDDNWMVTTVIVPEAKTSAGSYQTSVLANAGVVQAVNASRLQLLAQIHGHPEGWVGHSRGDDAGAFMPFRGFYSVILPYYGRRGLEPLDQCGFHRFDGQRFQHLDNAEVNHHIVLVDACIDLRGARAD